jgi:hypothetical protein
VLAFCSFFESQLGIALNFEYIYFPRYFRVSIFNLNDCAMRSNIIIAGGLLLLIVVLTTQRPFTTKQEIAKVEKGIVTELYETALKDFVVRLKDKSHIYYLDVSGMDGFSLAELRSKLLYKPVVIQYPDRWVPLKNKEEKFYISKLEANGELVYQDSE